MALIILLVSLPVMAQESEPTEETSPPEQKSSVLGKDINRLMNDKLGEGLAAFMANHPKAQCKKRDATLSDCHVWADVSIGGVTVQGVEKCASEPSGSAPTMHCLQGIDAHFVSELLAGISYLVEGDDEFKGKIAAALKIEYGPPTSDDENQTMWSNNLLMLSVTLLQPNEKVSYVAITLDLKPSDVGEDP
jgi:hypothetical protein